MSKEEAKQQIAKLVEKYQQVKASGKDNKYTEEETKKGFIEPLFLALGWDISDKNEVTAEEQISKDRVDYGFYLNGRIKFYLEAKPLKADIHREDYAKQAIRYSWNKGVTWAVLSDFENLIVFNALSPEKSLAGKKYLSFTCEEYLRRFDELWRLSKEAFAEDILDKEAEKVGKKLQKISVTEKLAQDLNHCREILTRSFALSNESKKLDRHIIGEGVQKLLDRLIFIRVLEDKKLEESILIPLIRQWESRGRKGAPYQIMIEKFRSLDKDYNSSIFKEHTFETWEENNGKTEEVIKILYGDSGYFEYDFSAIPADVLGAVYENYLGYKFLQTKADLFGKDVELHKDSKKRKEQGIYYTPKFIVDYIVKNALGPILYKCKSINDLQKIKVLDPACGSGSFLVAAMNEIAKRYENFSQKPPDVWTKIQILQANIYGVDLDEQAVELAKLNLLLNTIDEKTKLPNLDHVKNGNSLISGTDEELTKPFGKNCRDKKAFNWKEEFPEVFKQGGFDCIIGNPPWVTVTHNELGEEVVKFFKEKYAGAEGFKINLFPLFVELGLDLLKKDGVVSLIIPNRLLDTPSYKGVREKFVNKYEILDIQNIPSGAFEEVVAGNIILTIQKKKNSQNEIVVSSFDSKNQLKLKMSDIIKNQNLTININTNTETSLITKKMKEAKTISLKEICDIHVGMMVKNKDEKFSKEPIGTPIIVGKDLARYLIKTKSYFFPEKIEIFGGTKNPKKHSEHPKLFVRKTGNTIICSLDNEGIFAEQSVYLVLPRDKNFDIKFLCAYLNSRLISFYFQNELITNPEAYPYIQHYDLESIPIANIDNEKQKILSQLADRIISLKKSLQQASENSNEWEKLKDEIAKTDQKIDQEVYKLYGLTEEEIKIVEIGNK